jgi:hypothetical protein
MSIGVLSLDFTGIADVIPEGTYDVELVKIAKGESQAGNPMLNFTYKILTGEFEGRVVFDNVPLLESTLWRMRLVLIGLGIDPAEIEGQARIDVDSLVGNRSRITLVHRKYQGETRLNIRRFEPISAFDTTLTQLGDVDAEELESELEELFSEE